MSDCGGAALCWDVTADPSLSRWGWRFLVVDRFVAVKRFRTDGNPHELEGWSVYAHTTVQAADAWVGQSIVERQEYYGATVTAGPVQVAVTDEEFEGLSLPLMRTVTVLQSLRERVCVALECSSVGMEEHGATLIDHSVYDALSRLEDPS